MTNSPQICVIVTTFNHELYISECINSILNQTRNPDRIIVCIDKSIDSTEEIVRSYANKSIEIISHEFRVGPFWNTFSGFSRLTNEIACFIDGDDVWVDTFKLQKVYYEFCTKKNLTLISHKHLRVDESLRPTGEIDLTHKTIERIKKLPPPQYDDELRFAAMTKRFWFGSAYSIYLDRIDLSEFLKLVQFRSECCVAYFDLILGPYVALKSGKNSIKYMDDVLFYYRIHTNGSGSANSTAAQLLSIERLSATDSLAFYVLKANSAPKRVLDLYSIYNLEYQYLASLYRGEVLLGFKLLIRISKLLISENRLTKEVVRFLSVAIFKPKGFLTLKRFYHLLVN